jgi:hypothetical protein
MERVLGTGIEAQQLSDVDLWIQLTLAEIAEYEDDLDEPLPPENIARFAQDTLVDEIDRRWGSGALDRVSTVITGGHFSQDDELRWLRGPNVESFMQLVRGERQPESFGLFGNLD